MTNRSEKNAVITQLSLRIITRISYTLYEIKFHIFIVEYCSILNNGVSSIHYFHNSILNAFAYLTIVFIISDCVVNCNHTKKSL